MNVKSAIITLLLFDSYSLKDKRSIIKSIIHKTHNKFNVSIAEVKEHDVLNKAILGLSIVSNNSNKNEHIFNNIVDFVEKNYPVEIIEICDYY
ncbi:hypothetical protein SH1V18_14070 [Vallitalea longa]|uniref:DUF503 domain-containing protein n=1 Tax=Vallitalea longa TaxID=2936439 RepID=A0A9W5Y871_9FIRM|nr:DUF503 domain-containing protein [Vallitalea longa]GKX28927.1 hypothetical protein SH1V18_14070 [Vallitalea longa]